MATERETRGLVGAKFPLSLFCILPFATPLTITLIMSDSIKMDSIFANGKRTSSRVLEEPGGKSSVHLGWDSPKRKVQKTGETKEFMSVSNHEQEKEVSCNPMAVSSNLYANGNSQNTGNFLTDRPTSKVSQPPGGKSSIQFG